jgi:hypothetical protein
VRDIVFLFGAGASHGAGDILPEAPPLGFQLYAELARSYPGSWAALPNEVSLALRQNFEGGMKIIYERMSRAIPQLMREMAVYFAQFRPASGRSLYCSLLDRLRSLGLIERVLLSTLNYDCVLEFSLLQKGIAPSLFQSTTENHNVPVWKLHGSCNMFATGVEATPGVDYSMGVTFEGGIEAVFDTNEVIGRWLGATALAPVMCLYMHDKPLNVAPSTIKQLQAMWNEEVSRSRAVFCIGVNPNPSDTHIWQPIAKAHGDVFFICGQTGFDAWTSEFRPVRSVLIAERFGDGFRQLEGSLAQYAT